ncbi:MAG: hypothetical protein M1813_002446 [Trichoglossum hirsutum]|nr:MAG: hypothetical protein M1813_002446 [Trichoglossum hirsutum]
MSAEWAVFDAAHCERGEVDHQAQQARTSLCTPSTLRLPTRSPCDPYLGYSERPPSTRDKSRSEAAHHIMTDISHPLTTQTAPHQLGPINAHVTPATSSTTSHDLTITTPEDEPYTIKCICPFLDDDGSTVLCDKCGTWQHIECYYYPSNDVPEVHHCTDCGGTKYDTKAATERQRRKREHPGVEKTKRPASKSHKKKPRDQKQSNLQVDSWPLHDKQDVLYPSDPKSASPRDQPQAKRPKITHKNSGSMSSHVAVKSPSLGPSESRKVARALSHATRSPSKSPPPFNSLAIEDRSESYTPEFMQLYKRDPGDKDSPANVYSSIDFLNQTQSWLSDPAVLHRVCGATSPSEIFQQHPGIDLAPLPRISKRKKEDHRVEFYGSHPVWMFLTADSFIPTGSLIGELKGEIVGHLDNYKDDGRNRWRTLRHPEPFVFFHPRLPVYIDTRKEGTLLRYVRRSCRPNLEMKILVTNNTEWHYCFVATEDIHPDSELTIAWEYLPPIREYLDRHMDHDSFVRDGDFQSVAQWINFVLANFGGCACESNTGCVFSKFSYRQNSAAPSELSAIQANGTKPRKQKRSKNPTPLSGTVPMEINRASSEGPRNSDHRDEHDDSRSTSGSVNSKSRSRDLTPATHFSGDVPSAVLAGTELTDREKRKIERVEKTFERIGEGRGRKKRVSGGSNPNNPGVGIYTAPPPQRGQQADRKYQKQCPNSGPPLSSTSLPNTPALVLRGGYVDASTSRTQSGSPTSDFPHRGPVLASPTKSSPMSTSLVGTPRVSSPVARPNYQNSSTQTDPEDDAWYSPPPTFLPKKRVIPYAQRLLERCQEDRSRFEMERKRKSDAITISDDAPVPPLDFSRPEGQNLKQESDLSPIGERTTNTDTAGVPPPPIDPPQDTIMTDSVLLGDGSHASPSSAIQPLDPNIQKTNTSNSTKINTILEGPFQDAESTPFKLAHPNTIGNGNSAEFRTPNFNNHRPTDLRLQPPQIPRLSDSSPTTPSIQSTPSPATTSSLQPPYVNTKFPPSLTRNNTVQASPIKKKLSLSEYAQRKKVETPTTEKPRWGFEVPNSNHLSGSTVPVPSGILQPSTSPAEETKDSSGLNGSAIADSP